LNEEGIPTGIGGGEDLASAGCEYEGKDMRAVTVAETVGVGSKHLAGMDLATGNVLEEPEDTGKGGKESVNLGGAID
jgi:hypothetical protein